MEATVHCARCGKTDAPALPRPPLHGDLGKELAERVCADCWSEWRRVEVMVINELRLNFMDPNAQQVLDQQMRQFFLLDGPAPGAPALPTTT
jgi:Fe-S cluster biosynthesis and repair protein YggX